MRLIDVDNIRFSNGLNENGILYVPYGEIKSAPTVKLSDLAMAEAAAHLAAGCDETCAFFNDCNCTPIFCKWVYIAKKCAMAEAKNDGTGAD